MHFYKRVLPVSTLVLAIGFSLAWVVLGRFLHAQSDQLVISGGTLIDGNGGPPLQDALLIIKQGRIDQVSQMGRLSLPQGAQVIDARGKTILPGFIDGHVHFREWHGELYLANGVTTIVDLGNADEWVIALMRARALGKIRMPRIFSSGSRLGAEMSLRRTDLNRPVASNKPHFVFVDVEEAKRIIQEKKKKGLTVIKVDESWTQGDLEEIAKMAHSLDLSVVGHTTDPREAARAGQDAVMHMWGIVPATVGDPAKLEALRSGQVKDIYSLMDPSTFPELISLLVSRKVFFDPQPFLDGPSNNEEQYESEDYELLSRPELQYIPLGARVAIARKHHELKSKTSSERESFQNNYQAFLRQFVDAGGKLIVGTDTVVSSLPGVGLRRDMVVLQESGIDQMTIIQAATKNPAELYRLKELGTIEPGKQADIQIVNGNPLADLSTLKNIEMVIIGGEIMDLTFHSDYRVGFERPYAEDAAALNPPRLGAIEPKTAVQGSDSVEITVMGSRYDEFTTVLFNGTRLPTQAISSTRLKATVDAELLRNPGTYRVSLEDPRFLWRPSEEYYGFVVTHENPLP